MIQRSDWCEVGCSIGGRMQKLDEFSNWMNDNSNLAESSIYKYTGAVNTISNEMVERGVINKSLLQMNLLEIDISVQNILNNNYFINKNLTGRRMYSNALKQFRYFVLELSENHNEEDAIGKIIAQSPDIDETEKMTIIRARIGQGKYRSGLIDKYNGRCVVTGIDKKSLLVASHIKPWSVSENNERIDTENGLLLCANMDRLFDCGLITFNDKGKMIISSFVGEQNRLRLHISNECVVDLKATSRLLAYMEYHRDVLFIK